LFIITIVGEEYKCQRSPLSGFLHPPVTSLLSSPNIHLSILFLNVLSLHFSLQIREQISHPYRTTGKTKFLYILIFLFSTADKMTNDSGLNDSKHYPDLFPLNLTRNYILICYFISQIFEL
jgi:uncharacterized membrane protein